MSTVINIRLGSRVPSIRTAAKRWVGGINRRIELDREAFLEAVHSEGAYKWVEQFGDMLPSA